MTLVRKDAPAERSNTGETAKGFGDQDVKVKGKRANASQRRVIDEVLTQADQDRASRRVMIAAIMTITQESRAGEEAVSVSGEHLGPFHQDKGWGSEEDRKDPAGATHNFLITGPSAWKKVNGGVKNAPGNLAEAIEKVQHSGVPQGYGQWEREAENTVDAWLASDSHGEASYTKKYEFTRGDRQGSRENSWDAMARLVGEVGAYRWAAFNTLFAASGDELRQQAASLTIRGDEPWLLKEPAWTWANNRAITEVTLEVLADRWSVTPGGCVVCHADLGATVAGRYMVWHIDGESLDSPVQTVVLRRPTRLKTEPPSETAEREGGDSNELKDICKDISENRHKYVYGGSHGPKLSSLEPSSPFDCSSSVSYALHRAGMFKGSVAIVSGAFASSYGKPGKGDEFTIWANDGHVWLEGYDSDGKFAWRFDTSQHGGQSGPAYTEKPRNDQSRFTARHWPGH